MIKEYIVGNVIGVDGLTVAVLMREKTNMLTYFFDGKMYRGINIGEYVGINRGPYKIVARIEKEYLEDKFGEVEDQTYELNRFSRKVQLSIVGSFLNDEFKFGIRCLPLIYNEVVLLSEAEIQTVIQGNYIKADNIIPFGKGVYEKIKISLCWDKLFNTHIGILGNTGSGKSNTLAKLYTELFRLNEEEVISLDNKSRFLFIDFNGEYTGENTLSSEKKVIKLSTRTEETDRLQIYSHMFWDVEMLSILFSATEKTQQPFLKKTIKFYLDTEKMDITTEKIIDGICAGFRNVYFGNNHRELLELLNRSYYLIGLCDEKGEFIDGLDTDEEIKLWSRCSWNSKHKTFYFKGENGTDTYFNGNISKEDINSEAELLYRIISCGEILQNINELNPTTKLELIINLQLIYGLRYNHIQFDHISPLLSRVQSRSLFLNKLIEVSNEEEEIDLIKVIDMRDCNLEAKKIIPLLVAKQEYETHKDITREDEEIKNTFHFIIDEAHNILSEQSKREEESWKDYRLEVFEEIIKEGRKFGFFLTIASQRPYDISPTVMSQLHNYFLHRLVNELDLKMIDNTISFLDRLSKQQIPNLAPGQCIVTGTSFEMPLLVQVDRLKRDEIPKSEDADLKRIWAVKLLDDS